MAYKNWKLMNKIDVAVRTTTEFYDFTGYIVEHGDKDALEKAKNWARVRDYDYVKKEYTKTYEPEVHTFDNKEFTAKILNSAGGSSQGGRLSFWRCEIEKDGVKFTIGVNDAILADLIKNSEIKNGLIKEKLIFARKGGQLGLIHEKMDAYADATADMKQKAEMKKAKKTSKWEIGGVYSTLTQTSVCLGQIYDTYEEYIDNDSYGSWYSRNYFALRERDVPVETTAWVNIHSFEDKPESFTSLLKKELDGEYFSLYTGKPPARAKETQLEVKEEDLKLLDRLLAKRIDTSYESNSNKEIKNRYVRELK